MKKDVTLQQKLSVNLAVQDLLRQDARIQDLYFNISEMKLSHRYLLMPLSMTLFGLKAELLYKYGWMREASCIKIQYTFGSLLHCLKMV